MLGQLQQLLSKRFDLDRAAFDASWFACVDFVRQEVERFADQRTVARKVDNRDVILCIAF